MSDIVAFLRARLDEDEQYARSIPGMYEDAGMTAEMDNQGGLSGPDRERRLLRDVEAKRKIVELHLPERLGYFTDINCQQCRVHDPCPTLRFLALPYADHPDYDEAWRVG